MDRLFEITDNELFGSVTKQLQETLTTEELMSYMDQFSGRYGVTHEFYNTVCEWYVDGKIKLVRSAWKDEPEEWRHLSHWPKFINVKNYLKIRELRKDKKDWEKNWRDYDDKYPIYGDVKFRNDSYCHSEFWMGEYHSRNTYLHINHAVFSKAKMDKYQFMIEVVRNKENFYSDFGQEYVFEFTGEDSKKTFVEEFRSKICASIAGNLIEKRHQQLLQDETNKTTALFGTLFTNQEKN